MSEGEVIDQLVQHAGLLLSGVGVFFMILSVYLAGLLFYVALIHRTFFYKWRPPAEARGLP